MITLWRIACVLTSTALFSATLTISQQNGAESYLSTILHCAAAMWMGGEWHKLWRGDA